MSIQVTKGVITDKISESTSGNGVTIDGVLLKDNAVTANQVTEKTSGSGVLVKGRTDGTAISAGYVGETVVTTFSKAQATTTNVVFNTGSYTPSAGVWMIFCNSEYLVDGVTGCAYMSSDVNTASETLRDGSKVNRITITGSVNAGGSGCPLIINTTGSTIVYAIGQYNFSSQTTGGITTTLTAIRIA
jgi:hypothetical protein